MSVLLNNLLHFARLLRSLGIEVHAGRMIDVTRALEYVDIGRRSDFYYTLQSLLVHRPQDIAPFAEAFRVFWRPPPGEWSPDDLRALGEHRPTSRPDQTPVASSSLADAGGEGRKCGTPQVSVPPGDTPPLDDAALATHAEPAVERVDPVSYAPHEVSRVKDFEQFTKEELDRARASIAALTWDPGMRLTRRWAARRGHELDLRRLVRHNMRYGGEPLLLPTRGRTMKRRPLVLICDVSGSMERYARMLLHFMHSVAGGLRHAEAFLFAARLTRVTHQLTRTRGARDLPDIPKGVPGWGGGTRIGDALRTFNVRWARRVLAHGAVVLLISDGWDRGEPELLSHEMARLQRSCHRLIWLNPLLGSPEYQPLTRGMQAALPFVDDFLPVHNLASLEALAEHLNRLPERRRARRRRATGAEPLSPADIRRTGPSSSSTPPRAGADPLAP